MIRWISLLACGFTLAANATFTAPAHGVQDGQGGFGGTPANRAPKVEIPWNRLYDTDEIYALLDQLQAAFPRLVTREVIGQSYEGREMRVYTLNNPDTGAATEKPAMWVDANVHGNEVQGSEVVVYLAWYLLENYGHNERVTELLDRVSFYLLPMVNPDGRASWFNEAHSASSSRTGVKPLDNDGDGLLDEDGPDDLDGDGHIVSMRKYVPGEGDYRLHPDEPRVMERVPANERGVRGDWILLGREGIDNDGDGRINEDGKGGYDMNRSDPSMWQPPHVQFGADPYPLYWPETRCIALFLYDHPNTAALQSFHNAGGMILRGPGAEAFGEYERGDLSVFDELGQDGERMLPYYRYMIIWKDLYSVFGGFATFGYEGLGIISFTNELWTRSRNYPQQGREPQGRENSHYFDDNLLLGEGFVDWHKVDHPFYGEIEVGGFKKDVGRVPPTFLIEEMLHRNAMFCIKHAAAMPEVEVLSSEVSELSDGVFAVDVRFHNKRVIPTRTAHAARQKIGRPDVFTIRGEGIEVIAGGFRSDRFRPERIDLAEREPDRLVSERGIGPRADVDVRWIVRGSGAFTVGFEGDQVRDISAELTLP